MQGMKIVFTFWSKLTLRSHTTGKFHGSQTAVWVRMGRIYPVRFKERL